MWIEETGHGFIVHGYDEDNLPWFPTRQEADEFVKTHS